MHYGQHSYYDVSDLNAKWDQALPAVAGLGRSNGILDGNSLRIRGLGETYYPWREESADTRALQENLNVWLSQHGYQQIAADGVLGPATCGALAAMCDVDGCTAPTTCQESVAPSRAGTARSGTTEVSHARLSAGGPNWLMIGGAVGLAAIGAAIIMKKKRR